jgi:hypothetical protein
MYKKDLLSLQPSDEASASRPYFFHRVIREADESMHFAQAQSYRFGILLALYAVDDDCTGKILAGNKAAPLSCFPSTLKNKTAGPAMNPRPVLIRRTSPCTLHPKYQATDARIGRLMVYQSSSWRLSASISRRDSRPSPVRGRKDSIWSAMHGLTSARW